MDPKLENGRKNEKREKTNQRRGNVEMWRRGEEKRKKKNACPSPDGRNRRCE